MIENVMLKLHGVFILPKLGGGRHGPDGKQQVWPCQPHMTWNVSLKMESGNVKSHSDHVSYVLQYGKRTMLKSIVLLVWTKSRSDNYVSTKETSNH